MKEAFNLPNLLTYLRMLLIPFFALTFFMVGADPNYIAFTIFIVASATDILDGFIARKFKMVSTIGKVLDPLADKLLKITVLVSFVIVGVVPIWFVAAMLLLDLTLVISASVLYKREIVITSNYLGKSGTLITAVGIILAFFNTQLNGAHLYALYLGLAIVLASVISYFVVFLKIKNKKEVSQ